MFRHFNPVTRCGSPDPLRQEPPQATKRQAVRRKTTLLLLAEDTLLPHLSHLLSQHNFAICATSELRMARAILSITPIDLILYHPTPDMGYGGWETYTHLRSVTTIPVLAIFNLTTAHFPKPAQPTAVDSIDHDLENYLNLINLLDVTLRNLRNLC